MSAAKYRVSTEAAKMVRSDPEAALAMSSSASDVTSPVELTQTRTLPQLLPPNPPVPPGHPLDSTMLPDEVSSRGDEESNDSLPGCPEQAEKLAPANSSAGLVSVKRRSNSTGSGARSAMKKKHSTESHDSGGSRRDSILKAVNFEDADGTKDKEGTLSHRQSSFCAKAFTISTVPLSRDVDQPFCAAAQFSPEVKPAKTSFSWRSKKPQPPPLQAINPDPPPTFSGLGLTVDPDTLKLVAVIEKNLCKYGLPIGLAGSVGRILTEIDGVKIMCYDDIETAYRAWLLKQTERISVKLSKYANHAPPTESSAAENSTVLPNQVEGDAVAERENVVTIKTPPKTPLTAAGSTTTADADAELLHRLSESLKGRTESFYATSSAASYKRSFVAALRHTLTDLTAVAAFTMLSTLLLSTVYIIWLTSGDWSDMPTKAPGGMFNMSGPMLNPTLDDLLSYGATVVDKDIRTAWAIVEWIAVGVLQLNVLFCLVPVIVWRWLVMIQLVAGIAIILWLHEEKVSSEAKLSFYYPALIIFFGVVVLDAIYLKAVGKKKSVLIIFSLVCPCLYFWYSYASILQTFDDDSTPEWLQGVFLLVVYPLASFVVATLLSTLSRHAKIADNGFLSVSFSISVVIISSVVQRLMLVRARQWLQVTAAFYLSFVHFIERRFFLHKAVMLDRMIIRRVYPVFPSLKENISDEEGAGIGGTMRERSLSMSRGNSMREKTEDALDLDIIELSSNDDDEASEVWTEGAWFQDSLVAEYFAGLVVEIAAITTIALFQMAAWGKARYVFDMFSHSASERSYWIGVLFVIQMAAELCSAVLSLLNQNCPATSAKINLLEFIVRIARRPRIISLLSGSLFFLITLAISLCKIDLKVSTQCTLYQPPSDTTAYIGHLACANVSTDLSEDWLLNLNTGGSMNFPELNTTYCCSWQDYLMDAHVYYP
eukprot:Rhum_TRINITY_DN20772_c0_g1::Rhum_TRINITY_DN20772_c0_g1_i1::g.172091::m.172091